MTGKHLHDYDLQLCNYALGNIRQYLDEPVFARRLRETLGAGSLRDYLLREGRYGDPQEWLLLNDMELGALALDCDASPLNREWRSYEAVHRCHVDTVREVREELTREAAEEWSTACSEFGRRLEREGLRLSEGIEIVHEWVIRLRLYLRAMGANALLPIPEGRSPTPTCPSPAAAPPAGSEPRTAKQNFDEPSVEALKGAIRECGPNATPRLLIEKAKINHQKGRNILRMLQDAKQYSGFSRPRPVRYTEGRPNER